MLNNTFNSANLPQHQHNILSNPQQQHATNNLLQTSSTAINYMQQLPQIQYHVQQQHQHQHQLSQLSAPQPLPAQQQQQQQPVVSTINGVPTTTTTTGTGTLLEPLKMQQQYCNENLIEKSYFAATSIRSSSHPNTILITNNFAQNAQPQMTTQTQHHRDSLSGNYGNNNIRIVSTTNGTLPQHIYGLNNNNNIPKDVQHLSQLSAINQHQLQQPQQLYGQQLLTHSSPQHHNFFGQQQHNVSEILPTTPTTTFAQQNFVHAHAAHQQPLEISTTLAAPQYYMPTEPTGPATAAKLLPTLTQTTIATSGGITQELRDGKSAATSSVPVSSIQPANSSTVVLDRINICINNHYTDSSSSGGICSPATAIASAPVQQPSPIIPAIQHKPMVDTMGGLLIDPYASNESSVLVIDEPDSTTTTPHTPPTTPENSIATCSVSFTATTVQSPSTTSTTGTLNEILTYEIHDEESTHAPQSLTPPSFPAAATSSTAPNSPPSLSTSDKEQNSLFHVVSSNESIKCSTLTLTMQENNPLLPPTPPTPPPPTPACIPTPTQPTFTEGEDVFIKRQDGRFYLGTVIDHARQQFLVRFDDKSEIWCSCDEMKKLGSSSNGGNDNATKTEGMCVSCKRTEIDNKIERCERCGRGYHRNCTTETSPGSGDWICKRCAKPMKVKNSAGVVNAKKATVCRQLPYHVDTLNWDEKHRVNEEQIYCYCGKTGKFDQNMLQCCKCSNWFHTHCMQQFKSQILRGDGFFVFCCSVCNDGVEFLRRLQMNWVDLMHLTLYNLSAMKKHQHHKYHHLIKDIYPFVLEKRKSLPIVKEWIDMSETELLECIKKTLNDNADRFICGREIKRDYYYYALRNNGPPVLPKINIKANDVVCDELLVRHLKLNLLKNAPENKSSYSKLLQRQTLITTAAPKDDIYEFRLDDEDNEDGDEDEDDEADIDGDDIASSSDDEIPIQQILDKVKKNKAALNNYNNSTALPITTKPKNLLSNIDKIDMNDENANDATIAFLQVSKITTKTTSTIITAASSSSTTTPTTTTTISTASAIANAAAKETSSNSNEDISSTPSPANNSPKIERSSRKRKAFTLSKPYKQRAEEAAAKPYDASRLCDTSSDENSSSSRGTSLDLIIPPPKNFLGLNNPFRMLTPQNQTNADYNRQMSNAANSAGGAGNISGSVIKSSIFNTTTLDFSSKLAALKSAGIFPNLSTSNLAKAAGQPRTVRTIKRRLSAKDITIGPNQEVRRRRIKRSSANVEVISTTTINPIPSTFFALYAKDLKQTTTPTTSTTTITTTLNSNNTLLNSTTAKQQPALSSSSPPSPTVSEQSTVSLSATASNKPPHGRRLRERPSQKLSPNNSRRSSISSTSSSSVQPLTANDTNTASGTTIQDLKLTVNEYFGIVNRIEAGEQFIVRAKRHLPNGKTQYLLEWGDATSATWSSPAKAN